MSDRLAALVNEHFVVGIHGSADTKALMLALALYCDEQGHFAVINPTDKTVVMLRLVMPEPMVLPRPVRRAVRRWRR